MSVIELPKQKIVNFFAGPGAGKSTLAARFFSEMKFRRASCELVTEYVKEGEWEGRTGKIRDNQDYIFGKQHFRLRRLEGEVEYIITDSPILLTLVYGTPAYLPALDELAMQAYNRMDNLNLFVNRSKGYVKKGRSQTHEEAMDKDEEIKDMLRKHNLPFVEIEYSRLTADYIIPNVIMPEHGWEV